MKKILLLVLYFCTQSGISQASKASLIVLGTVQDGGSPHIGCKKQCCAALFTNPDPTRQVVSLGLVDHEYQKTFVLDASPDFTTQLKLLQGYTQEERKAPDGILLTHAHIGHYTGLMYLGREALGGKNIPVYAMPKMKHFLETNGPWSQLVSLNNIGLIQMKADEEIALTPNLRVQPFGVPHRGEYSETVGFKIMGREKSILFIPDIDKWHLWEKSIIDELKKVDVAFLDATFYDGNEVNNRDIAEIPHPFVIESLALFKDLPMEEKNKIHFIHLNHTNPLLDENSSEAKNIRNQGFKIAQFEQQIGL